MIINTNLSIWCYEHIAITYNLGCEYGDKGTNCATLVKSQADSPNCYAGHNADVCCEACGKLYNAARVGKTFQSVTL